MERGATAGGVVLALCGVAVVGWMTLGGYARWLARVAMK